MELFIRTECRVEKGFDFFSIIVYRDNHELLTTVLVGEMSKSGELILIFLKSMEFVWG